MKRLSASLSLVCTLGVLAGCQGANEVTGPGAFESAKAVATPPPAPPTPARRSPLGGQPVGRGEPRLVPPRPTPPGGFHPTYPPCINVTGTGDLERKNKPCSYD
jgi:hypothetical protein